MRTIERLLDVIEVLAADDASRYFSIEEIAEAADVGPKTTRAWLAVLRCRRQVAGVLGDDNRYWYTTRTEET